MAIISFSILIFLGTLYLSTLIFEDLSDILIVASKWVIIVYFLIMVSIPMLIIGEYILTVIQEKKSKSSSHYHFTVHCKEKDNNYEIYVDRNKHPEWFRSNIKEINIVFKYESGMSNKAIKLTSCNKWKQKTD
ncbi:hypothetical protein IR135_04325 [Jeotgalicoccus nanhaiensis]|uniref:Uncharacterized protein n=2 Tax=Jeotgalicoccus nanhaiensis TaxID=568603 RepID=A0ABR9XY29_9STAP|nr:hypothetical protein [Jeotgalicoccus nanhaiensis]